MHNKTKKIKYIFFIYWFLLVYIVAALVWWFIALNNQNKKMANYKIQELQVKNAVYTEQVKKINIEKKRKTIQYAGEGITFFLVIVAGAAVVFYLVRKELRQSQQQQNFMMALTHELKTPIAVTKLNLETLQKRKLDETQQQRLLQITLQEANRLNTLCNNMLLSSQIEASGFRISTEEINFSQLVYDCAQDFTLRFPQRSIVTQLQDELFTNGDKLLLQLAVNNLIDNAVKYSSKEAVITLTLQIINNLIALQVKDLGKGIVNDEKDKVFTKFYRTGNAATKAAKGTGLGLYLALKIVQEHNGNISMTDNIPTGCIFTITIPASV